MALFGTKEGYMAHTFFYDPSFDYSSITLSGKRAGTDKKRQKFPHMYVSVLTV